MRGFLLGSFISPSNPIYKKSVRKFKKNLLGMDYEKELKKRRKISLKEFIKMTDNLI